MPRLDGLPPTFTTATALRLGLHRRDLYRLRDDGELNAQGSPASLCSAIPSTPCSRRS
ncbi:tRNA A37 threonylcarbamoyladenosine biosynthesis protein TsaE [Saccharothrix ecbatanensis]|uniref:tRNA A37 threonylcarbamoyladenosine biosynthesis protein TsaE n=1 Tax=Saccharothrix ecbatanensis TaxID=1105145 RepID=A0A7W9HTN2_9PSEU|nr:type IV toxin-antitoxin system AbiEi family antitoxin domain-containing protein [Saccharothrix ecbatanensis]MBB5807759.1 tRNA A37 threonylcarbamoyladenosine biosynthesis protein TsaE [Saccharothrix ecbatanensis]